MPNNSSPPFKKRYYNLSGHAGMKHMKILAEISKKLAALGKKCVRDYEASHPGCYFVGAIFFYIDDMPDIRLDNSKLSHCDAMIERPLPPELKRLILEDSVRILTNCRGISFFYPDGRRLERIHIRMAVLNLIDSETSHFHACRLEEKIIYSFISTLPSGNRYLDEISTRARRITAHGILERFGKKEFCGLKDFCQTMGKYGFGIYENDNQILESVWCSSVSIPKMGDYDEVRS